MATQTVYFNNPQQFEQVNTNVTGILSSYYNPSFKYGVASGDPLQDRVILWTHCKVDSNDETLIVRYEVSTGSNFATIVSSGETTTDIDKDYTVKVDATGLQPNQTYYYRFSVTGSNVLGTSYSITSPIGQTKTLPTGSISEVKMAVASCTNYSAGYFHAYREIANSDCDVVLHLGDYIYEYGSTGYATADSKTLKRFNNPPHEITTLSDYRKRHAQYKSDANSKLMHSLKPVIAIWDDHEITNDAYMTGAQNHTEGTEGIWSDRVNYALQAYHEWMPIRTGSDRRKIYRTFNWGNLVNLHMLDTRLIGREKQISLVDYAGYAGAGAQIAAATAYATPTRQLLGEEQKTWLFNEMTSNTGTWTVLGQQVIMARVEFPLTVLASAAPILAGIATSPAAIAAAGAAIATGANDYLTAKYLVSIGAGATLTPAQSGAYYAPKLGYNLDSWDGYIYARENVLAKAKELNKNLITLSGDVHNAFYNDLTMKGLAGVTGSTGGTLVGYEFVTTSVSSPGFEEYLPIGDASVNTLFTQVPDDVNWIDPSKRGYLKLTFTPTQVVANWDLLNTVKSTSYTVTAAPTRTVAKTY